MRREQLFHKNLRLVDKAVWLYRRIYDGWLEHEDARQLAMIGLWNAAGRFSPQRKHRFSTYAITAMRNEIVKAVQRFKWVKRGAFTKPAHLSQMPSVEDSRVCLRRTDMGKPTGHDVYDCRGISPSAGLEAQDVREFARHCLNMLPRRSRQAAIAYMNGTPVDQLCVARSALYQAFKRLRQPHYYARYQDVTS